MPEQTKTKKQKTPLSQRRFIFRPETDDRTHFLLTLCGDVSEVVGEVYKVRKSWVARRLISAGLGTSSSSDEYFLPFPTSNLALLALCSAIGITDVTHSPTPFSHDYSFSIKSGGRSKPAA